MEGVSHLENVEAEQESPQDFVGQQGQEESQEGSFSTALHARLFTRAVRFNQRTLGFYLDGFSGSGRIS